MNIELLTLSQVTNVSGEAGDFTVQVKQSPRYIDMDKCIACGLCTEKCPKKVDDEYNQGLNKRKAAYIEYGQAVPLKYVIDPVNCIYIQKGKCKACEKYCPTGAVNFEDKEEIRDISVGAVIAAPGFKPYNPEEIDFYGHDRKVIPDCVTSLEYERLLSASGPCMGHLVRPSDSTEPKNIAWLQCVGSRNSNKCENGFCSAACCMYAIKQAAVTAEHTTGDIEQAIFYMDMRTHGKEYERYYVDAEEKGIKFIRARPHTVMPGPEGKGVRIRYMSEAGEETYEDYDMFVLSIGLEAPATAKDLSAALGIEADKYGFAKTDSFAPVAASRDGIFVSGAYGGPKDIPQSVTEASSAAAMAAASLVSAKNSLTKEKVYPAEMDVAGADPRIGVFVCSCGINIAGTVDVKAVMEYASTLPGVAYVDNNLFSCSADTQDLISEKIKEHNLNRVVVAACTPRTHEPLFQDTMQSIGLNKYLFEMANIRNQNSWVHTNEPEKATEKAMGQVRMAVAKAGRLAPLDKISVDVVQKAVVIGGGLSGLTAAKSLSDMGYPVTLLEKSDVLGGNAWALSHTWKGEDIGTFVQQMVDAVEGDDNITVYKNAELKTATGSVGNFVSQVEVGGEEVALNYGAAVVATGGKEFKPNEYLYGQDDRVLTHLEFEALLKSNPDALKNAKNVAFIQCVGSREPDRPYCSRVCCSHTVEGTLRLKEMNPDMGVYVFNRDIRTYGGREDIFTESRRQGAMYIRYETDGKPKVANEGGQLTIEGYDPMLRDAVKMPIDYLVLATAVVPHDPQALNKLYKCSYSTDGFLSEAHPKLRPVDLGVDGLFVAGLCHYPKPVDESVAQAFAAAARAGTILSQKTKVLDSIKSYRTENCDGCALCVDVCPYWAIALEEYEKDGYTHKRITTDTALCKGCGLCEATCPKLGVEVHGFTMDQLKAQVDAALEEMKA